jgi:hypothetical protein
MSFKHSTKDRIGMSIFVFSGATAITLLIFGLKWLAYRDFPDQWMGNLQELFLAFWMAGMPIILFGLLYFWSKEY